MLTLEKIYKASEVLKEVAGKTDILPASKIFCDNHIFLKTENIQSTGSFKVRGAYFKISELTEEEKKRGVIACSAGNHAQMCIRDSPTTVTFLPTLTSQQRSSLSLTTTGSVSAMSLSRLTSSENS